MSATLDSSTVVQFLADNPSFFEEHAGLLSEIRLSSPLTGRAVSLQERQMEVMRDKYKALELRMAELARLAEENATIAARFHGWNQAMLRVRQAAEMPRVLVDGLIDGFKVPYATLRLWQLPPEHQDAWFARDVSEDARIFADSLLAPYCGSNHDFEAVRWLDAGPGVQSTVILPLRAAAGAAAFGLLILGSPDPARFTANMATDFLGHMGETASAAVSALYA